MAQAQLQHHDDDDDDDDENEGEEEDCDNDKWPIMTALTMITTATAITTLSPSTWVNMGPHESKRVHIISNIIKMKCK